MIFLSSNASGSDPCSLSAGAAEAGMGYSCITKTGFWSSFHNQAILAGNKSLSFGFSYDNRFNIKELGTRHAAFTMPAGKASLGALYSHFGYPDFRREMAGLACGIKLSETISAGVMIDYFSRKTAGEYSNTRTITFEAGVTIRASENVIAAIHLFNPVPNSVRRTSMPSRVRGGAGIHLSNSIFAGAEAEMSTNGRIILKTGFEYETGKKIFIRSGFSTDNTSFTFGLGYLLNFVKLDIGFATHERLGVTSSASITFQLRND